MKRILCETPVPAVPPKYQLWWSSEIVAGKGLSGDATRKIMKMVKTKKNMMVKMMTIKMMMMKIVAGSLIGAVTRKESHVGTIIAPYILHCATR